MRRFKIVDKTETIKNILDRANKSMGKIDINVDKFNKRKDDIAFLKEAATFVGAEVVYK